MGNKMRIVARTVGVLIGAGLSSLSIASCLFEEKDTGPLETGVFGAAAESEISNKVILPNEGPTLDNPTEDPTVTVGGSGSGGTVEVKAGGTVTVSIPFQAANGNVVGAGIRFGANGPIRTVNMPQMQGQMSGTLTFDIQIPDSICNNLSSICHDVKCYEFAVTDIGQVSAADINDIAMQCGNCDEPSCQELITDCDPGFQGDVFCASDSDPSICVDFCIEVSSSGTATSCWYDVGGQIINCTNCTNPSGDEACAQQAAEVAANVCG